MGKNIKSLIKNKKRVTSYRCAIDGYLFGEKSKTSYNTKLGETPSPNTANAGPIMSPSTIFFTHAQHRGKYLFFTHATLMEKGKKITINETSMDRCNDANHYNIQRKSDQAPHQTRCREHNRALIPALIHQNNDQRH